jgi:hypothetical protein
MGSTVFFGNGINQISDNAVSWEVLLNKLKGSNKFESCQLPNTLVYERIFMEQHVANKSQEADELQVKDIIASALKSQDSNVIFKLLSNMDVDNYLTTNYDYAFEKTLDNIPQKLSTEKIYSLRRKRKYKTSRGNKYLWNIHGEIDVPKTIMLGMDHYCGSVSKIESYVKGRYDYEVNGKSKSVEPMHKKLNNGSYCFTSWIDLFFSSNIHIIGFSLDYSEIDIWWLLNKRARFAAEGNVSNRIFFYVDRIDKQKLDLLKSFKVEVVITEVINDDYKSMYKSALEKMSFKI